MKNNAARENAASGVSFKKLLISFGVGTVVCMIILLIAAWVLLYRDASATVLKVISSGALCIGSFVSGFVYARLVRNKGLICGVVSGILMFGVYYIAGLLLGAAAFSVLVLVRLVLVVLFACSGGIVGVNTALKRKF